MKLKESKRTSVSLWIWFFIAFFVTTIGLALYHYPCLILSLNQLIKAASEEVKDVIWKGVNMTRMSTCEAMFHYHLQRETLHNFGIETIQSSSYSEIDRLMISLDFNFLK